MYVEKSLREALEGFLKGRKVIAITDLGDGSLYTERLENMLPKESHYMVDVPAVDNPEFEKALAGMVEQREGTKKRIIVEEPDLNSQDCEVIDETDKEGEKIDEKIDTCAVPLGSRKIR